MTTIRFVIADMDGDDDDPVLFWSNEDGWVGWGTPSIAEYTVTEAEQTPHLPLGNKGGKNVKWITKKNAEDVVRELRITRSDFRLFEVSVVANPPPGCDVAIGVTTALKPKKR